LFWKFCGIVTCLPSIACCGACLPKKKLLAVVLAGKDNLTSLAVEAARKALEMAKVDPDDLDLILMCTSTPEDLFGSAPQVWVQDVSC